MAEHTTAEQLLIHVEYIRVGIDRIEGRLDELNGRTRETEAAIAVLQDRANDSRKSGRNWGITAGGIGSALGAALAYMFGK